MVMAPGATLYPMIKCMNDVAVLANYYGWQTSAGNMQLWC
jgi:hypothetical protein